jgi:exodeoxyribonuclease VII large subunit
MGCATRWTRSFSTERDAAGPEFSDRDSKPIGWVTMLPYEEGQSSVFTVSELNAQIKGLLESTYRLVWVKGEISNFRMPGSGHYYFTLKDETSQIRAVFFRPQHRHLRFVPESGLQVLCQGRVSVYEPRGEYQIIVEVMEPQGLGALQLAFEQLKKKLEAEGLFDTARKKPLPTCPRSLAIVTSPTGAAIRDVLKILQRSPYPLSITILPVRVQGAEAAGEISAAIRSANALAGSFEWDLLIVGRGGGSIEDLWPFNEEIVARAIASSDIPVISAVGHEIDFTISDLVSDLRMPTPTAAAEWVLARLDHLQRTLVQSEDRILKSVTRMLGNTAKELRFLQTRLKDPRHRLADLRLLVDDRSERLRMALVRHLDKCGTAHAHLTARLFYLSPVRRIQDHRTLLDGQMSRLNLHFRRLLDACRFKLKECAARLESLNPLAVLARGYSVTFRLPDKRVLRRAADVRKGGRVLVMLSQGRLECTVAEVHDESTVS